MTAALATQVTGGEPAQFVLHLPHQLFAGILGTRAPAIQQPGDVVAFGVAGFIGELASVMPFQPRTKFIVSLSLKAPWPWRPRRSRCAAYR